MFLKTMAALAVATLLLASAPPALGAAAPETTQEEAPSLTAWFFGLLPFSIAGPEEPATANSNACQAGDRHCGLDPNGLSGSQRAVNDGHCGIDPNGLSGSQCAENDGHCGIDPDG